MIVTLISFIVLLVILIFVHELGHFLAAKLVGVRVERFSLGFPPKIWSKRVGETEYQICWLPVGGYVKLLGEEPGGEVAPADRPFSFTHKPYLSKMLVSFSGPFFNVVFAFLALWILSFAMGVQHLAPVLGPMAPDSPAYLAGVRVGDVVKAVDGRPVSYFDEISELVEEAGEGPVRLEVERGAMALAFDIVPSVKSGKTILGDPTSYQTLGLIPRTRPVIGQVIHGKAARGAGLKEGDLVLSINGAAISDWQELVEMVQGPEGQRAAEIPPPPRELRIKVLRDGAELEIAATPEAEGMQNLEGKTLYTYMLGIAVKPDLIVEPVGLIAAMASGARETWATVDLTYRTLAKLVQAKISAKVMGGPIMIAEVAGRRIRDGLAEFIALMALISVNLAIINLVPLPILDGGQMVIFTIEAIRRKPLSMRIREVTQIVGVTCLFALMALVFYNDISRQVVKFMGPPSVQTETSGE